ncbi:isochorismatase domain-containing protein 2A-like [Manduca sexta]|uniref:isochorismatase domain-containing protein 2A-like n=1 Tax=Manduca sexta TaxID=7130 RepID=UPI00188F629B|nr:isochorismatase domain-containing protein 2A-like [Manduca sexta]
MRILLSMCWLMVFSSRSLMDRGLALQRLQNIGCFVGTSENVLFKIMKDKNHPAFKQISRMNIVPTPDEFGASSLKSQSL